MGVVHCTRCGALVTSISQYVSNHVVLHNSYHNFSRSDWTSHSLQMKWFCTRNVGALSQAMFQIGRIKWAGYRYSWLSLLHTHCTIYLYSTIGQSIDSAYNLSGIFTLGCEGPSYRAIYVQYM